MVTGRRRFYVTGLLEKVIKVYQRYVGKFIDIERLFNELVINSVNEGFVRKDLRGTYQLWDGTKKSMGVQELMKIITIN